MLKKIIIKLRSFKYLCEQQELDSAVKAICTIESEKLILKFSLAIVLSIYNKKLGMNINFCRNR
jgi:hypothetical protein